VAAGTGSMDREYLSGGEAEKVKGDVLNQAGGVTRGLPGVL